MEIGTTTSQYFPVLPARPPSSGTTAVRPIQAVRGNSPATTRAAPVQGTQRGNSLSPTAIRPVSVSQQGNTPMSTSVYRIRPIVQPTITVSATKYIPYDRGTTRVQASVRAVNIPENQGPRMMIALRGRQANDAAAAKAQTTRPYKPDTDLDSGRSRLADATARRNVSRSNRGSIGTVQVVPQPQVPFPRTVAARLYSAAQAM